MPGFHPQSGSQFVGEDDIKFLELATDEEVLQISDPCLRCFSGHVGGVGGQKQPVVHISVKNKLIGGTG